MAAANEVMLMSAAIIEVLRGPSHTALYRTYPFRLGPWTTPWVSGLSRIVRVDYELPDTACNVTKVPIRRSPDTREGR